MVVVYGRLLWMHLSYTHFLALIYAYVAPASWKYVLKSIGFNFTNTV